MRLKEILLIALLSPWLSACASSHQNTTAASPSASTLQGDAPHAGVKSTYSILVDVSGGNGASAEPLQLMVNQSVSGTLEIKKQGSIDAFNVQIGNYHNTSDGALAVTLCDGDVCSEGAASVEKSADNRYLQIPLKRRIEATEGGMLRYTLTRTAGTRSLAIWTYSSPNATTVMPDGTSQPRALKIGLDYKGGSILKFLVELAIGVLLLGWLILKKVSFRTLVTAGMLMAAGLILAMIIVSPDKAMTHPDEPFHLAAYKYYVNHLLPPAVDSPATVPSTSGFGFSYLFNLDVVYEIAARVTGQVRAWTLNNYFFAGRMFQFGLWSILCALAMCRRRWAGVLCVVLLTPQVWYVFSYFNADAFPFFLSLIVAVLVSDEQSGLHKFLRGDGIKHFSLWAAALCIGLILVSKSNYLPVVPAFVLWLAILHLNLRARFVALIVAGLLALGTAQMLNGVLGGAAVFASWYKPLMVIGCVLVTVAVAYVCWQWWKDTRTRKVMFRLAGFVLACIVVALPRIAWDVYVNGWPAQKETRIQTVEDARALPNFKPSTIARNEGYPTMGLASRGVSLEHIVFAPYNWASTSAASAFGVYGYMDIWAPNWIYFTLYGFAGFFICLALYQVRDRYPRHWVALCSVVMGCSILILASSLLFSWIFDLEAQGRYLLPILPMIALLIGCEAHGWRQRMFALLVGAAFVVSACSFCFVALQKFA